MSCRPPAPVLTNLARGFASARAGDQRRRDAPQPGSPTTQRSAAHHTRRLPRAPAPALAKARGGPRTVSASIKARTLWQLLLPRQRLCSPFRCSRRDGPYLRAPAIVHRQTDDDLARSRRLGDTDLHRRPAMRRPDRRLRHWHADGPGHIFETNVETQLAPTLRPGGVVVLDNLPAIKSAAASRPFAPWVLGLIPSSL
jgi:hypothetical protein